MVKEFPTDERCAQEMRKELNALRCDIARVRKEKDQIKARLTHFMTEAERDRRRGDRYVRILKDLHACMKRAESATEVDDPSALEQLAAFEAMR